MRFRSSRSAWNRAITTGVTCGVLHSIEPRPIPLEDEFGNVLRNVPNLRLALMDDGEPAPDFGDSGAPVYLEYPKRKARAVGILSASLLLDGAPAMMYSHEPGPEWLERAHLHESSVLSMAIR